MTNPSFPHVAGMLVGFYKSVSFVEYDCPFCGRGHEVTLRDDNDEFFPVIAPCCNHVVLMTGCVAHCPMEQDQGLGLE